jgi:hypothetical protein
MRAADTTQRVAKHRETRNRPLSQVCGPGERAEGERHEIASRAPMVLASLSAYPSQQDESNPGRNDERRQRRRPRIGTSRG